MSAQEALLWARVVSTVRALEPPRDAGSPEPQPASGDGASAKLAGPSRPVPRGAPQPPNATAPPRLPPARPLDSQTLDASWDRKLGRGLVSPDVTLDLHGTSLDGAYARLDQGLAMALAQGGRLVLLITGRPQARIDPADRAIRRGAIRAKYLDWLAQGSHAAQIAAIRPAHPRHGGAGAVYIVLRKR